MKTKVLTSQPHFPIPPDYIPTVPIPLPRIILQLAKKPSDAFLKSFIEAIEPLGGQKVEVGKGLPTFTIERPSFSAISGSLRGVANHQSPQIEGYAQYASAFSSLQIYQFVDLFLRVQTYEYKGRLPDDDPAVGAVGPDAAAPYEIRNNVNWYRSGADSKNYKTLLALPLDKKRKVDDEEELDLTPKHLYTLNGAQTVLVAKPSPLPSSVNFGSPRDVPNKPGLLFPYFRGMLSSDTKGLRELVSTLMFRNIGDQKDKDPKEGYKHLRSVISTFANTEEGIIMTHIMTGCRLALDAQAILFLVFADGFYRGFCLLGEHFQVFHNGSWHTPLQATSLRTELDEIRTKQQSLTTLAAKLGQCEDHGGDVLQVDEARLSDMQYLAYMLSQVKIEDDQKDLEQEISSLLGSILHVTEYRTFKPTLIADALESLSKPDKDISSVPFYIPTTGWGGIDAREYQVFAAFGPKSFSFRTTKGTEFRIPAKSTDTDQLRGDKKTREEGVFNKILVYEKPVREAVRDWSEVKKHCSIRMDVAERAGGQRAHLFLNEQKDIIWNRLKELAASGHLVQGEDGPPLKKQRIEMGTADFTAEFTL
jgi:hypothetical protein